MKFKTIISTLNTRRCKTISAWEKKPEVTFSRDTIMLLFRWRRYYAVILIVSPSALLAPSLSRYIDRSEVTEISRQSIMVQV